MSENVITPEVCRRFVQRFAERMNAPIDEAKERRFKQEWIRRGEMAMRGEIDTHPFVGLMANWKDD